MVKVQNDGQTLGMTSKTLNKIIPNILGQGSECIAVEYGARSYDCKPIENPVAQQQ